MHRALFTANELAGIGAPNTNTVRRVGRIDAVPAQ